MGWLIVAFPVAIFAAFWALFLLVAHADMVRE